MDPYDLPEEFSHLQAQDMSKLGFMQDLIRGIKKITRSSESATPVKETVIVNSGSVNTAPLLKRAFMFLEDGNFKDANDYCEKVLDIDPENAQAYLGKLMAELGVRTKEKLADLVEPFYDSDNYRKVIRFGDLSLKEELGGYLKSVEKNKEEAHEKARLRLEEESRKKKARMEEARLKDEQLSVEIYDNAVNAMNSAKNKKDYLNAEHLFKSIKGFRNADELAQKCFEEFDKKNNRAQIIYSAAFLLFLVTVIILIIVFSDLQ